MSALRVRSRRILVILGTLGIAFSMFLGTIVVTSPASAATPSKGSAAVIARAIFRAINSERARNHLPPLKMNTRLISSAHAHNLAMAKRNTMSHQLPGEASLATRISRTGYHWTTAGENIGWNSDWRLAGAYALQRAMYGEHPPNDGHRRNILNKQFKDVGVDIYMDAAHHRMWLTEDFGRAG